MCENDKKRGPGSDSCWIAALLFLILLAVAALVYLAWVSGP